ncbi:18927_t:CDS:1, partial [Gigaspora margarita]
FQTNKILKTSVLLENLSDWIQRNYVKEIEKSIEIYEDEENISIDNDNFTQIICERICDIKNICEEYYKKTNSVYKKYWNILDGINKSTNEKKFIIELAEKFFPFSKKFDPINYRFKPKLIPYIK